MVSAKQSLCTRRSRRLAGLGPSAQRRHGNHTNNLTGRFRPRVTTPQTDRNANDQTDASYSLVSSRGAGSRSPQTVTSTVSHSSSNNSGQDGGRVGELPLHSQFDSGPEQPAAVENASVSPLLTYAPDSETTSALDTLDTASISPNLASNSGVPESQTLPSTTIEQSNSSSQTAPNGPSLRSSTRHSRGREWLRRRRLPALSHRNAPSMHMSATFPEEIGSGALPVRGESFCSCPQASQSRDLQCSCGDEDKLFEWAWDVQSKSSASDLSDDGRDVRFHINYSSGTAAARGNQPMTHRQYFWEIKMTTPVYGTDMMVGVGTAVSDLDAYRYSFCSLLGRDAESWGLSYYGRVQHKGRFVNLKGSRFGQGSIVGIHLDMWRGILSFYKNRQPLGIGYTGLNNKALYPMVSSTAARTGMRLIKACSFPTSLQFLCCQVLREIVPPHLNVIDALKLPPGLQAFLTNNLRWLLRPNELAEPVAGVSSRCVPRKRAWTQQSGGDSSSSSDETESEPLNRAKRKRRSKSRSQTNAGCADSSNSSPSSPSSSDEILPSSWQESPAIQPS